MKALVTGGAGFIGSHLAERLVRDGHDVRVLDNFATGRRAEHPPRSPTTSSWSRATSRATSARTPRSAECEIVFHQAALPSVPRSIQDPLTSNATNVIGTLNVLLAARDAGVRRVVFASSSSVYGENPVLPKTGGPGHAADRPVRGWQSSPARATAAASARAYGLETVCLRYFNVFGPRQDPLSQYSAVIPSFIAALRERPKPDDLRRRRAVARLHLRRERGGGQPPRRRQRRTCIGRGLQHRRRRTGHPQPAVGGAAASSSASRWRRTTLPHESARFATRSPT